MRRLMVAGTTIAAAVTCLFALMDLDMLLGLIPGIVVSWFVRDDDVAETRDLAPVPAAPRT